MPSHRITTAWLGEEVETLQDLLRPGLRAVVVGINPSRVSVEAGHYYQGKLGLLLYRRLEAVGLFAGAPRGSEDDALFEQGVGFTDIVKRPSARAHELTTTDFEHGRAQLEAKLSANPVPLVIYVFKQAATILHGRFRGAGFISGKGDPVARFVMPSPYAARAVSQELLEQLRSHLAYESKDVG